MPGQASRGGGIGEEAARFRELLVARLQFRHGLAHALGIFELEGDEAVAPLGMRVADQRVKGGVIPREFRIAPSGGMFEKKLARGAGESRQELDQMARRAFECVSPGREQIEGERHGREQVRREPLRVDQRADLPVGSLAPGAVWAISNPRP